MGYSESSLWKGLNFNFVIKLPQTYSIFSLNKVSVVWNIIQIAAVGINIKPKKASMKAITTEIISPLLETTG